MCEGTPFPSLVLVTYLLILDQKARSSSQRKELFKEIQQRKGLDPLQLLIDMKVRWGSTYVMLNRADIRKEVRMVFLSKTPIYLNFYSGN